MKYAVGTNQYKKRSKKIKTLKGFLAFTGIIVGFSIVINLELAERYTSVNASPIPLKGEINITPTPTSIPTPTAIPTPTELEQVVAYIARKFEPEGKDVVVKAINCFYSESGLRSNAVGQNNDAPRSKDHGVAQLNDYWHKLTPEMKTDIYANIDKAYEIYKGRGGNFEAWYGKLCN